MISGETIRYRISKANPSISRAKSSLTSEKFAHHVMLLFFLIRDEKQFLSDCPALYQNKQQKKKKKGIQDIVNRNKIKFESYGDLVYQSFSQLNKNSIKNQDSHSQTENDITPGAKISQ